LIIIGEINYCYCYWNFWTADLGLFFR